MSLEEFLDALHFNIDKIQPPDWEVDWEDSPLPYKLYRGLPVFPLSPDVPLMLEKREPPVKPDLRGIGHFLWYVYGLTQICQTVDPLNLNFTSQMCRRFVPSGGALYPNELYVYLKAEELPAGVYHYDVAHHRLVLLREGDFDSYLGKSLGNRCDVSACFGTVFVSVMFWKNFFKYHNFAYRLQGLDTGVLIGQMLEVAKRFGFATGVYFQFLDRAVNHLLGLSGQEESVYAVIPLSLEPAATWLNDGNDGDGDVSAAELCQELKEVQHDQYLRSLRVREHPMLTRINEASMLESSRSFRRIAAKRNSGEGGETLALPEVKRLSYDLASVSRKRHSPGMNFVLSKVSQWQLAALFREATVSFPYHNDLDGVQEKPVHRVFLYGCLYGVEGIPDGAYLYDSVSHVLRRVRLGDHRLLLQQGMNLHNVNLTQVPLCLHVAGDRDHLKAALGYRGYRIQQMEAGMLVQRLLLAATAIGMGGHPLLGFDVSLCDEIYKMDWQRKTSLIQIPVGPFRPSSRLEGGLHG